MEILGLIATGFVLLSFLMNGEKQIRMMNIVGAVLFVVYGLGIGALSVWILNAVLIIIQIVKIMKLNRGNRYGEK